MGCGGVKPVEKNETNVFPPEKFSVVQAEKNGKPILGTINQSYKNYDKKKQYPWCLRITIGLEKYQSNGLPEGDETAIATGQEDSILEGIKSLETAHYVGHIFNDGFLDLYIYLPDPKKVHAYLQARIEKKDHVRSFVYEIKEDSDWEQVKAFMP
jgi:hypothetical protein